MGEERGGTDTAAIFRYMFVRDMMVVVENVGCEMELECSRAWPGELRRRTFRVRSRNW
jgi:hypothetical protein